MCFYVTHIVYTQFVTEVWIYNYWFLLFIFSVPLRRIDAPSVSVHLANEEPIPSRLIIRSEHDNVTLKCRANANPPVESNSFGWYKNVSKSLLPLVL